MSNSYFRFRQFTVCHDRCAMKVGTDGVLLGAWGAVAGTRVLDIGTGTGLIALMAAQRNALAHVTAIDVDASAVAQAQENAEASPFADRLTVLLQDVLNYMPEAPFDAILCNPPFFTEDTLPKGESRTLARNSQSLPFSSLIERVEGLLATEGSFSVILPHAAMQTFVSLCLEHGLHLTRRCLVRTVERKPPRRVLLTFCRQATAVMEEQLMLTGPDGQRSKAYQALAADFYL